MLIGAPAVAFAGLVIWPGIVFDGALQRVVGFRQVRVLACARQAG